MDNKKRLSDDIAEVLLSQIVVEKKYLPGDKLPNEIDLSKELGVSRITLREAIRILVTRHVLEIKRGKGTFVREDYDVQSYEKFNILPEVKMGADDLYEIRLIFEPEMAAMSAQFATRKDIQYIKDCCYEVENLINEGKDYYKEDANFHVAIAKASGNSIIHKITQVIHSSIKKNIFMTDNTLCKDTIVFHKRIIDCIENGDISGAKYAMINHLDAQRRFLIDNYKYKLTRKQL